VKRLAALAGVAALALTSFGSANIARAGNSINSARAVPRAAKTVAQSASGSYIVVMASKPLVKTLSPAQVGTPAADAPEAAIDRSHDQVLAEEGVSAATKVQDYANAIDGFSAKLPYDKALALANNPKVAMVLPDELRHLDSSG